MNSDRGNGAFTPLGFPIRTSPAQRSVGNSPELFAATHVLHRLLAPRHPPHALSSLLTLIPQQPASRRNWLKLETKVQAPALRRGPERIHLLRRFSKRAEPLSQPDCLLNDAENFSAEIDFYPSYELVKERPEHCFRKPGEAGSIPPAGCRRVAQSLPMERLVGLGGLEPPTSRLSGARSSQLSYRPSGFSSFCLSKNRALLARPLKTRQQTLDSCRNVDLVDLIAACAAGTPCGAEALTVYPVSLERR